MNFLNESEGLSKTLMDIKFSAELCGLENKEEEEIIQVCEKM